MGGACCGGVGRRGLGGGGSGGGGCWVLLGAVLWVDVIVVARARYNEVVRVGVFSAGGVDGGVRVQVVNLFYLFINYKYVWLNQPNIVQNIAVS